MKATIASLFSRAARRIALDNKQFRFRGVLFLAIRQLTRQTQTIQGAFTTSHVARFTCCFACSRCINYFAAQNLRVYWTFLQISTQGFCNNFLYRTTNLTRNQFIFGLTGEFWLRNFDRQNARQTFAHVITRNFYFCFFSNLVLINIFIDDTRHCGSQTR